MTSVLRRRVNANTRPGLGGQDHSRLGERAPETPPTEPVKSRRLLYIEHLELIIKSQQM